MISHAAAAMLALVASVPALAVAGEGFCASCRFERVATCGGFLEGPSIDTAGRLRVVDYASGDVLEVKGGKCTRVANSGGRANGSRLDAAGSLLVADAQRGILRMGKDARFSVEVAAEPGQPGANDLAFDSKGGLYFTVPGASSYLNRTGKVYYRPAGGKARLFRDGLAFPNGVAVSPDGKYVFVGQFSDKTILALSSADNADALKGDHVLAHTNGGIGPDGMIVDSHQHVIWANFLGRSLGVARPDWTVIGNIPLPPEAGALVTNIVEHQGAYYVTEAEKGEIWKLTGLEF